MIRAKYTKPLWQFSYDFLDETGRKIGQLTLPDLAVATNARLKELVPKSFQQQARIEIDGQGYRVDFEYLTRAWANDIRFTLRAGDASLATAVVVHRKRARPELRLESPFQATFVRRSSLFTARCELADGQGVIGTFAERSALSLRREFLIDLPSTVTRPVQCFLFYLMTNFALR